MRRVAPERAKAGRLAGHHLGVFKGHLTPVPITDCAARWEAAQVMEELPLAAAVP